MLQSSPETAPWSAHSHTRAPGASAPASALSWGCQLSGSQTIAAQEHIVATTARGAAGLLRQARGIGATLCVGSFP